MNTTSTGLTDLKQGTILKITPRGRVAELVEAEGRVAHTAALIALDSEADVKFLIIAGFDEGQSLEDFGVLVDAGDMGWEVVA